MRLIGPLRRPLWLAAAVGEGVLEVALDVVREVRSALEEVRVSEPQTGASKAPRRATVTASEPGLFDSTRGGGPAVQRASRPPRPRRVPPRAPDVPAPPVVQSPPPPVSVTEPWEGYDRMNVKAVKDRLAGADSEVLAAVVLYEGSAKKRSSVTEAAERRLTRLNPPPRSS